MSDGKEDERLREMLTTLRYFKVDVSVILNQHLTTITVRANRLDYDYSTPPEMDRVMEMYKQIREIEQELMLMAANLERRF